MSAIGSFFHGLVSYRFMALCGVLMGLWIYDVHTETRPLSMYFTEIKTYAVAFLIVIGYRLFVWIVFEKATLYDIKGVIKTTILDYLIFVIMMMAMVGTLFLINTFLPMVL